MCNASNHSASCTCGWGGAGHQGKRSASHNAQNLWVKYWSFTKTSSYTNPNASCPVCGAGVYFYQSVSGGRVFFDELGPPWPKHPCTDNQKRPVSMPQLRSASDISNKNVQTWQKEGWIPFIVSSIVPQPPQFKLFNIRGTLNGKDFSLYTSVKGLDPKAPYLVKKINDKEYNLSTFQFYQHSALAKELKFVGYIFASSVPTMQSKR